MLYKPSSSLALPKGRAYCARQERCQQEVRDKLYAWEERRAQVEAIIAQLIGEGFLNEARSRPWQGLPSSGSLRLA